MALRRDDHSFGRKINVVEDIAIAICFVLHIPRHTFRAVDERMFLGYDGGCLVHYTDSPKTNSETPRDGERCVKTQVTFIIS